MAPMDRVLKSAVILLLIAIAAILVLEAIYVAILLIDPPWQLI